MDEKCIMDGCSGAYIVDLANESYCLGFDRWLNVK